MRKKEDSYSSIAVNLGQEHLRNRRPFLHLQENKKSNVTSLFSNSNDSVINNTNNDIMDDEDIDEENIFEKTIGEQILHTPINETHRLFSSKTKFGKTFINAIPLKRILVPKSKSPNIRNHGILRKRNEIKLNNDSLKKNLTSNDAIFSLNNDFLHCRNCMLIVALSRYGKYYFN